MQSGRNGLTDNPWLLQVYRLPVAEHVNISAKHFLKSDFFLVRSNIVIKSSLSSNRVIMNLKSFFEGQTLLTDAADT